MSRKRLYALLAGSGLLIGGLSLVPLSASASLGDHTRIILDADKLASLRERAKAGDPGWTALKKQCDAYLTGKVEWPDGKDYPEGGSVGEGYQGDTYFTAVTNLGICHQVALGTDQGKAKKYGAKGVDVLTRMSAPEGDPHAPNPKSDSVYGIRFYGLGMALGYDWLRDAMSSAERTRVYKAIGRWVDTYEDSGFGRQHPQGNYFAGYYATKAVAALATEGDDPRAKEQWSDFLTRVHGKMVQPYYAKNVSGGGWPEGQNYGPLATFNMALPAVAAKTAKGKDLIHGDKPFAFPSGAADWYMYNVWPSLKRVDDRGTMRVEGEPAPAPARAITELAGMMPYWDDPKAAEFHRFARDVRKANPGRPAPERLWSDFVFWDDSAPEKPYKDRPLASLAKGMEMGSTRSGWDKKAVWGSLNAGPYTGFHDSQEQLFDAGSLAVAHGNKPFLVNASGQIFRGTAQVDEFLFKDNREGRDLYNVFYTDAPSPRGQATTNRAQGAKTRMSAFDRQKNYTFMRASNLADMYPRSGGKSVSSWTRDVVHVKPNLFVVYDRTRTTKADVGQWMRFHFAGVPKKVNSPAQGVNRYDIGSGDRYAGTVDTVLPRGHKESVTPKILEGTDVSRVDVKPGSAARDNRWLTVVDAAGKPSEAAKATPLSKADGNVLEGPVTGTVLRSGTDSYAVLSGTGPADSEITTPVEYRLPAGSTRNIITGLAPGTAYSVTTAAEGNDVVVTVAPGKGKKTSKAGVLEFTTGS
ncbi:hypothetical protein [Streptomyces sp. NPDC047108]|uniref:hypothetical protein n=1 Tax=Streptomyces sp. NPDC047108 TaxID=3155025 RepID=UPI0033DD26D0